MIFNKSLCKLVYLISLQGKMIEPWNFFLSYNFIRACHYEIFSAPVANMNAQCCVWYSSDDREVDYVVEYGLSLKTTLDFWTKVIYCYGGSSYLYAVTGMTVGCRGGTEWRLTVYLSAKNGMDNISWSIPSAFRYSSWRTSLLVQTRKSERNWAWVKKLWELVQGYIVTCKLFRFAEFDFQQIKVELLFLLENCAKYLIET